MPNWMVSHTSTWNEYRCNCLAEEEDGDDDDVDDDYIDMGMSTLVVSVCH